MSIASAIETLRGRISDAYDAAEEKGATIPTDTNLANLASTIATITGGGGRNLILNKQNGAVLHPNIGTSTFTYNFSEPVDVILFGESQERLYNSNQVYRTWDLVGKGNSSTEIGFRFGDAGAGQLPSLSYPYVKANICPFDDGADTYVCFLKCNGYHVSSTTVEMYSTYDACPGTRLENAYILVYSLDRTKSDIDWFQVATADPACLIKNTRISLANKTTKPIQDITYDDELLVWNFDEGKFDSAKPLWIKKSQTLDYYYHNVFKSGKTLDTTGKNSSGAGHRIFDLERNRFEYDTESIDRQCFTLDGADIHESCVKVNKPCEYYNIITDKHFNMFANGILTSCSLNNDLYPVKDMKFIKDNRELRPFEAYDVPIEYYKGLRLAESNRDVNEVNNYVNNLINVKI